MVRAAVASDGLALDYASPEFGKDRSVLILAEATRTLFRKFLVALP